MEVIIIIIVVVIVVVMVATRLLIKIMNSLMTLLDSRKTLGYLAYLGYNGDVREALKVTKTRKAERRRGRVQRSVFLCYVLGAAGSGKVGLDNQRLFRMSLTKS
jgi:hypothetical protein